MSNAYTLRWVASITVIELAALGVVVLAGVIPGPYVLYLVADIALGALVVYLTLRYVDILGRGGK